MHEPRDVLYRLSAAQRERPILIGGLAGGLGIDAHDAEMPEEPRADFRKPLPGNR